MNFAVDTTFFGHEEAYSKKLSLSTSLFTKDLLDGFEQLGKSADFTLIVSENHVELMNYLFPNYKKIVIRWWPLTIVSEISGGKIKATRLLKKLGIYSRIVSKHNFDLIWFPFTLQCTYVSTNIKGVCTIHDLYDVHRRDNQESFKEICNPQKNSIVCISNYTKNDVIKTFGYKNYIPVIPNSVVFAEKCLEEIPDLKKTFILDINAYIQKKNPVTLLKAYNLIKDNTDCDLVFCGAYKEDECFSQITSFIKDHSLTDRVHLYFRISEVQKNWLLNNAKLFVTPSLFEGFGRTPVEAAMSRIPVISTKETSLEEATMSLCHYVQIPTDENELASLMIEVLKNPDTDERLEYISNKLKNEYNPQNCAEKYLQIFQNLCN